MGHVAAGRDGRHERLRAVAPGHPDDHGPVVDCPFGELEEVVAGAQHDRHDAPFACLLLEPETLGLAAARLEVEDQRRGPVLLRGPGGDRGCVLGAHARALQRETGEQAEQREQQEQCEQYQHALPVCGEHDDQARSSEQRRCAPRDPP